MTTTADNDVIVSRSEFLGDIVSPATLGVNGFTILSKIFLNPGLATSFPWLSQIASNFAEYEWIQLVFEFKSMVPDGTSTGAGSIVMATDYNPGGSDFTSKSMMENYEHPTSGKITKKQMHAVECDPSKRAGSAAEYIRTGVVPAGEDIKSYDLGKTYLAVSGVPVSTNLGELWVHYKVRLSKAKIKSGLGVGSTILYTNTGLTVGACLGSTTVGTNIGTGGLVNTQIGSSNVITFPALPDNTLIKCILKWTITGTSATTGTGVQGPCIVNNGYFVPLGNNANLMTTSTSIQDISAAYATSSANDFNLTFFVRTQNMNAGGSNQVTVIIGTLASWFTGTVTSVSQCTCSFDIIDSDNLALRTIAVTTPSTYVDPNYYMRLSTYPLLPNRF
jgi:hypothetical protein